MNRLFNLDYLRGLAASGIMVYHIVSWTYGQPSIDSFLGKIGLYGVSIFYVLSGLTLYHVYFRSMNHTNDVGRFFVKRVFRIFPLLWIVTLLSIPLYGTPSIGTLSLNLSGLFAVYHWWDCVATGAWSIGNELSFYLFFPLIVFLAKKQRTLFWAASAIIFGVYCYFAFFRFHDGTLVENWPVYTHPLNQAFLFLSGFMIGLFVKNLNQKLAMGLLIIGLAIFFIPIGGNHIAAVTGWNRLLFTAASIFVCLGTFQITRPLPKVIHNPLSKMGEASYSIYLLHPIIIFLLGLVKNKFQIPTPIFIGLSIISTFLISYLVYTRFEKLFINRANELTRKRPKELQTILFTWTENGYSLSPGDFQIVHNLTGLKEFPEIAMEHLTLYLERKGFAVVVEPAPIPATPPETISAEIATPQYKTPV